MNTAKSHINFGDFNFPATTNSQPMITISPHDNPGADLRVLHMPDPTNQFPQPTFERCHTVLNADCMVVSASLMRRIQHELEHDECDVRTIFTYCRGLAKGTREFEQAYSNARIRSFMKNQRIYAEPHLNMEFYANSESHLPCQNAMGQNVPPPPHPLAVMNLGHLMSHLGIWVVVLLGVQSWAAWRLSALSNVYLEGGRFHFLAIGLFLLLALDSTVWFCSRGKLLDVFLVLGTVLFVIAILPIAFLHIMMKIQLQ
jgi:hypothetical protein